MIIIETSKNIETIYQLANKSKKTVTETLKSNSPIDVYNNNSLFNKSIAKPIKIILNNPSETYQNFALDELLRGTENKNNSINSNDILHNPINSISNPFTNLSQTKFRAIFDSWDKKDIYDFAKPISKELGITIPVQVQPLGKDIDGGCKPILRFDGHNYIMNIISYKLDPNEGRSPEEKALVVFHEAFHAKADNTRTDYRKLGDEKWRKIEETFAECVSHYMVEHELGIKKELPIVYSDYLIEVLPKLKKYTPDYKNCNTISDFGKVASKYRFGKRAMSNWGSTSSIVENNDLNIYDYAKNYIDYISLTKNELIDIILPEYPEYNKTPDKLLEHLDDILNMYTSKSIISASHLSNDEKGMFNDILIIAMNRLGVK